MYHVEISSNVLKWVICRLGSREAYIGAHSGGPDLHRDVVEQYQVTPPGGKHLSFPAYRNVTCWSATAKSLSRTLPGGSAFLKDALPQGVSPHLMSDHTGVQRFILLVSVVTNLKGPFISRTLCGIKRGSSMQL